MPAPTGKITTAKVVFPHKDGYQRGVWRRYNPIELALWVSNLCTSADNREFGQNMKIGRDLYDATHYLAMLKQWKDALNNHMPVEIPQAKLSLINAIKIDHKVINVVYSEVEKLLSETKIKYPTSLRDYQRTITNT